MGCCSSTNKHSEESAPPLKQKQLLKSNTSHEEETNNNKDPPSSLEEETVKEVLSEIPMSNPPFAKIEEEKMLAFPKIEEQNETPIPAFPKIEEERIEKKAPVVCTAEEISEISEICSLSESISFSTTTITERIEEEEWSRDDGEVRQKVNSSPAKVPRKRSFSGEFTGRTERGGKSPAKRSEPSPSRRNDGAVKSVHSREVSQATRRRILGTNGPGPKRDTGDSSGRRSRSPATRKKSGAPPRSALGRSLSARRTERSPSRDPVAENGRKPEETKEDNCRPTNESLDNPLVSLECFIFL